MSIRDKPFPMQKGPAIPWELAEEIYRMYSAMYGTSQSLERLAERGGFGWAEVEYITAEYQSRGKGDRARIRSYVIASQPLAPESPSGERSP